LDFNKFVNFLVIPIAGVGVGVGVGVTAGVVPGFANCVFPTVSRGIGASKNWTFRMPTFIELSNCREMRRNFPDKTLLPKNLFPQNLKTRNRNNTHY
jgi:hypothetical protein